jgi:regulator of protease activity HflC (stomatin/prohibitin superfamily)
MSAPVKKDFTYLSDYHGAVTEYERKKFMKTTIGISAAVVVGLVAITVLGGSWYTVDQGERGVILRNGAIVGTAEPGLGFKVPLVDKVVDIDVRTRSKLYENVMAYSRDQQTASLTLSVNYRIPIDAVTAVYEGYGSVENLSSRLLDRKVFDESKNIFGQFNAVTAIQDRSRLVAEIQMRLQSAVVGPIIIESVQIENIDFSEVYENSIEQRMLAEVEVQKVEQNALKEVATAKITVTRAQAEADAQVAQAKAQAEATRLAGNAEAEAINAKGQALRDNPALIELVAAERWDGVLPTTMVPGSAVPFVNIR